MKAFRIWVGILKDLAEMVLRWILVVMLLERALH